MATLSTTCDYFLSLGYTFIWLTRDWREHPDHHNLTSSSSSSSRVPTKSHLSPFSYHHLPPSITSSAVGLMYHPTRRPWPASCASVTKGVCKTNRANEKRACSDPTSRWESKDFEVKRLFWAHSRDYKHTKRAFIHRCRSNRRTRDDSPWDINICAGEKRKERGSEIIINYQLLLLLPRRIHPGLDQHIAPPLREGLYNTIRRIIRITHSLHIPARGNVIAALQFGCSEEEGKQ